MVGVITALAVMLTAVIAVNAEGYEPYSPEYMSSPYYTRLQEALESSQDKSVMERTLAVALSQEGYLNYALDGVDPEAARAEGKLWTGAELRMNDNLTGNTEYTRWAQQYILRLEGEDLYADYDWCAIFASWCLYQAGYYTAEELRTYYYSYSADPRIFYDADSWLGSYNFDQHNVYYVPKAHHKLDAMDWNTYYHVDVDPYDIPYKPGGLVFFSWDASGKYFDHVAIVVDYDADTHVLTYSNGNADGQVLTRSMDFDDEAYRGGALVKNAECLMGYADYDEIRAPEQKEITAETPYIVWDKAASSGIKIKTNTESVMARVYRGEEYMGSIIESNMIFHEGLLSIGRSELVGLPLGENRLRLVFDDGEAEVILYVTEDGEPSPGVIGDTDGDGRVTILDATTIQRWLAGMKELTELRQYLGDTDGDGRTTILDATQIQRWLALLPTSERIGEKA
jgi:hypothetical protein